MNFSVILGIIMTLLGKREELTKIVMEAIALFNKIRALIPDLDNLIKDIPTGGDPGGSTTPYSVTWLQESLNKLQNAGLVVDGSYGNATREAVKKFQAANGLTADGWAGVMTQAKIIELLKGA